MRFFHSKFSREHIEGQTTFSHQRIFRTMKLKGALLVILTMSITAIHGQENPTMGFGGYIAHAATTVFDFMKGVCAAIGTFFTVPYRKFQATPRTAQTLKNVTRQMLNKTGQFAHNGTNFDVIITGVNDNNITNNVTVEYRLGTEMMWNNLYHDLTTHNISVP